MSIPISTESEIAVRKKTSCGWLSFAEKPDTFSAPFEIACQSGAAPRS